MARKYTPRRPYYPARRYAQAADTGGGFAGGWKIGEQVGGGLGQLAKAIAAGQAQAKQNAVANQLLQQGGWAPPPRAGWVGGTAPAAGVPTGGTRPASGGVEELNMRIAEAKARQGLAQEQFGLQSAVAKQRLLEQAAMSGRRGGASPWGPGAGGASAAPFLAQAGQRQPMAAGSRAGAGKKAVGYEPGTAQPDDPATYDKYSTLRADVDNQYGKGIYDKLVASVGDVTIDPKTGKPQSAAPDELQVGPDYSMTFTPGGKTGAHIPGDDVRNFMARYDAARVRSGQNPLFVDHYLTTQSPESGDPGGSATNPYKVQDNVQLRALPDGAHFINPKDGKIYQKAAPATEQGGQPTAQVGPAAAGETELAQTTAPGPPAALSQIAPEVSAPTPMPQIAGLAPGNVPQSFSLGQLPAGGGAPDTQLADAIRMARTADQFGSAA